MFHTYCKNDSLHFVVVTPSLPRYDPALKVFPRSYTRPKTWRHEMHFLSLVSRCAYPAVPPLMDNNHSSAGTSQEMCVCVIVIYYIQMCKTHPQTHTHWGFVCNNVVTCSPPLLSITGPRDHNHGTTARGEKRVSTGGMGYPPVGCWHWALGLTFVNHLLDSVWHSSFTPRWSP